MERRNCGGSDMKRYLIFFETYGYGNEGDAELFMTTDSLDSKSINILYEKLKHEDYTYVVILDTKMFSSKGVLLEEIEDEMLLNGDERIYLYKKDRFQEAFLKDDWKKMEGVITV